MTNGWTKAGIRRGVRMNCLGVKVRVLLVHARAESG